MKHPALPLVAFSLGVALIVASYVWLGAQQGSTSAWTEADESEFNAAMTEYWVAHSNGHSHGDSASRSQDHSHGVVREFSDTEAEQAAERFNQQREKFEDAANRGRTLSFLLWWTGILLTLAGTGVVLGQRLTGESA